MDRSWDYNQHSRRRFSMGENNNRRAPGRNLVLFRSWLREPAMTCPEKQLRETLALHLDGGNTGHALGCRGECDKEDSTPGQRLCRKTQDALKLPPCAPAEEMSDQLKWALKEADAADWFEPRRRSHQILAAEVRRLRARDGAKS